MGMMNQSALVRVVAQRRRSRARRKPPVSRTIRLGAERATRRARNRAGAHDLFDFRGGEVQRSPGPTDVVSRWNEPLTAASRPKRMVGSRLVTASLLRDRLANVTVWTSRSACRILQPESSVVVPVFVTTLSCEPVNATA